MPKEYRFVPLFFGIPARSIVPFAQLSRTTVSRTTVSRTTECNQKYEILSKNVATKASAFAKATADRLRHEVLNTDFADYADSSATDYTVFFSPGKIKK